MQRPVSAFLALLAMAMFLLALVSCGGGGGSAGREEVQSNWDEMKWDTGRWE